MPAALSRQRLTVRSGLRLGRDFQPISYARYQFPPEFIRHSVWLYMRCTLGYRNVEELGGTISRRTRIRWCADASAGRSIHGISPALSIRSAVDNTFNLQRHLISRRTLRLFRAKATNQWQITAT
jgi:hypothetical protein